MYNFDNPHYRRKVIENMKYAAIATAIIILLATVAGYGQAKTYTLADTPVKIDTATGAMTYSEVIIVEGFTKDELYSRAKAFLQRAFTTDASTIQTDDKEEGVIAGRGRLMQTLTVGQAILAGPNYQVFYEITAEIRVKEGKYRYEFSNIDVITNGQRGRIDDNLRRFPKMAKRMAAQTFNERQYKAYISDKDALMLLGRRLKESMAAKVSKNDF